MGILTIDSLDDPLLEAGTGGFSGLNSRVRPALLQDSQLSKGDDNMIGESGMSQTRFPVKAISNPDITPATGEGIFFYDTRDKERIIASVNKNLYECKTLVSGNWTDLSQTVAGDVRFAQLDNNMFYVDGDNYWSWDGTTFTQIETFDSVTEKIPPFQDIISHGNRILLSVIDDADYDDDSIYASDLLDGSTVVSTYSIRVGGGDGDPIKKIVSWYGDFVAILKQKSTWVVNTSTLLGNSGGGVADPVNWVNELVSDTLGCIAPKSAVVVGNDVWFLSRDGLTSLRRAKESEQRQLSAIVLSKEVNDVFEDINWDYAYTACAGFFNNVYYISVPVESSQTPNRTLAFNTLTGQWSGKNTGTAWNPVCFNKSTFGDDRHLIFQHNNGNVYWQREGAVYEGRDELPYTVATSGTLVVGEAYVIYDFQAGDDFTNVGASSNATGVQFVATGTTPTTWTNGSTLTKYVYEDIDLDIETKAWDFGYPVNFKEGFNLEVDFYRSNGTVDIYLIPDDDLTRKLTVATGVRTNNNATIPETLPFTLNGNLDKRLVYEIDRGELGQFKELKCNIVGNASEVKLRRIQIAAFLDTIEIDNQ